MKRNVLSKVLNYIMVLSMLIALLPTCSVSVKAEEMAGGELSAEEMIYGAVEDENLYGYIDIGHQAESIPIPITYSELNVVEDVSLPTTYSSVEKGYVTSIKNQSPWGTCWAFAAIAAMESYVLRHGYETDASQVDFSEYGLVYLTYKDDLLMDQTGDYTEAELSNMDLLFNAGGCDEYAFKILNKGLGVYNEAGETYYEDSRMGIFKEYDAKDENCEYRLIGQTYISMQDKERVKAAIMENGGVASSYYDSTQYHADYYGIYNYNPLTQGQNHGIEIVGWDDTIPASNFSVQVNGQIYTPNNPGGWLVKNSWGSSSEYSGYIWISYEDVSILSADAVVYQVAPKAMYQNIYQHDGATIYNTYTQVQFAASVYTITGTSAQELTAVSFAICSSDSNYTISIYDSTDGSSLDEGVLLTQKTGSTLHEGYYTVNLDTPVCLEPGDVISVIIAFDEAEMVIVGPDDFAIMSERYGDVCTPLSTVQSTAQMGQSYVKVNEYYYFSDVVAEETHPIKMNNICMKLFTNDVVQTPPEDNPTPPAEDNPVPPAEDNPVPPAEDEPVPPAEDNPVPPAEDEPVPPAEDNPLPPTEDEPVVPEEITSSDVAVNQDSSVISRITVGATADDLVAMVNEKDYVAIYQNDIQVTGDTLLGTGMKACIISEGTVTKEYTIVVTGDTNGDGKINITDMIAIKASVLKKSNLFGVYAQAGDVNGDAKINITDFIKVKAHILKKDSIIGVVAN